MPHDDAFALSIGISRYQHAPPLPEVRDAEDVAEVLASPSHGGYPAANVDTLHEEAATRQAILQGLDRLADRSRPSSTVFLYFSGHGGSSAESGDCYLIPVDGVSATRDDLERSAIAGRELTERLRRIRAARLTVVLDCCRAAHLAEPKHAAPLALSPQLPPEALSPLARGAGRAVIAASRGDGFAYVRPGARNGIFTRHLLDGLRGAAVGVGGVIRICDLFQYVQEKVVADQPAQRPVFKAELEENYPVALYRGGQAPPLIVPPAPDAFAYDAFVSYRQDDAADRTWVESVLVPRLEGVGLRLCLEGRDFVLGRPRIREMERGVVESRYTVAVLTPGYLAGPFQDFQLVLAQHLATETSAPRFLPLLRRDARLPLGVRATAMLNATDDRTVDAALQRLALALREPPHPRLSA